MKALKYDRHKYDARFYVLQDTQLVTAKKNLFNEELNSLELTGEPVMVQRKKKPSGAQRKHLRKQKEASYNS